MSDSPSGSQEAQGLLSPFLARQRYTRAARYVQADDAVLDLGCGSGAFQAYLPEGAAYYGADIARYWPAGARDRFVVKVGQPLPAKLRQKRITAVTALALIEHLAKPGELFRDAGRALTGGGRFILTTPHPLGRKVHDLGGAVGVFSNDASEEHETFLDKRDLAELAKREGFKLTNYKRFLFGMNQIAAFEKI